MSAPNHAGATYTTDGEVIKPTPAKVMEDAGTGLGYRTRPDRMPGYLTPADRFFIRSHAPTPRLDTTTGHFASSAMGYANRSPAPTTIHGIAFRWFPGFARFECAGNTGCSPVRNSGARSRGAAVPRTGRLLEFTAPGVSALETTAALDAVRVLHATFISVVPDPRLGASPAA